MVRLITAVFLIAHGLIHPAIYVVPQDDRKPQPFDPGRSWALAAAHVAELPARSTGRVLSVMTAGVFTIAGVALLADWSLWVPLAASGAVAGLLLKSLFFNPWLIVGVAIDLGVLWAASAGWPASLV